MRPASDRKEQPLFGPVPPRREWEPHARTVTKEVAAPVPKSACNETAAHVASRWALALTVVTEIVRSLGSIPHYLRAGALGFVAGAIFWHFVGFWSFMSHIVFTSPETARHAPVPLGPSRQTSSIETGSLQRLETLTSPKIEKSCTTIIRDLSNGQTRQSECRKLSRRLRMKPSSPRQDRGVVPVVRPISSPPADVQGAQLSDWPIAQLTP